MPTTAKRRRSPSRGDGGLAQASPPLHPALRFLSRYWVQLAGVVAAGLLTTLLVGGDGEPFRFRLGERRDRELRLKSDVRIVNETRTRNERERLAEKARLAFLNDPAAVQTLRLQLVALARAVARQPDFDMLDPAVRQQWKLSEGAFATLREIVPSVEAVEGFDRNLRRILEPVMRYGTLDRQQIPPGRELDPDDKDIIEVVQPDGSVATPELRQVLFTNLADSQSQFLQRLRAEFPDEDEYSGLYSLIVPNLPPSTLDYDEERSQANVAQARETALPVYDPYRAGDLVVPAGGRIDEDQLRLLEEEHRRLTTDPARWLEHLLGAAPPMAPGQMQALQDGVLRWLERLAGLAVLVAALLATTVFYLTVFNRDFVEDRTRVLTFCGAFVLTVALGRAVSVEPFHAGMLPVAAFAFFATVAQSRPFALVLSLDLSLLLALTQPEPMDYFIVLVAGTAVGIMVIDRVRTRTKLILVGLYTGGAYALLTVAFGLLGDQPWDVILTDAARRFLCGLIAGFFISGFLPFMESLLAIVTDISLLELADTTHPLIQRLVQQAPGTYNHSVNVSFIAAAAADAIGANSLLVRVGALYHDIGKTNKPMYFIENQSGGPNRHDDLVPAMSTLVIIGHVKDGIDMALQHSLPAPIVDIIGQHHGTTLVEYFYNEAKNAQDASDDPEESVEESAFRYPGPKPQSKEAAVLMLSDAVESASRSLSEPNHARIEKLVHSIALARLLDGQFNESGLTLQEVAQVEESLIKSLTAVYHGRIKYPKAV